MASHATLSEKERFQKIKETLWFILALNWSVALVKIVVGHLVKLQSIRADGFHSLSDGFSNIIGLIGIWYASQPRDKDHPYGHKKYETLASAGIAGLLFLVSFDIVRNAIVRFSNPVIPQISIASILIIAATLFINIWVAKYEFGLGRKLQSDILISDSMHTGADVMLTVSVIIAMIAAKQGFVVVDPVVAVAIAVFIGYTAVKILRRSSHVLCDQSVVVADTIKNIVLSVEGVSECHKIRTRGRQDDIHIDLHVLLPDQTPLVKAHQVSYKIEEELRRKIPGTTDVIVHIEPLGDSRRD